jgi:hypothetical protein
MIGSETISLLNAAISPPRSAYPIGLDKHRMPCTPDPSALAIEASPVMMTAGRSALNRRRRIRMKKLGEQIDHHR